VIVKIKNIIFGARIIVALNLFFMVIPALSMENTGDRMNVFDMRTITCESLKNICVIPEAHYGFLEEILEILIEQGSLDSIEAVIFRGMPFDHNQIHKYDTLSTALQRNNTKLARFLIKSHLDIQKKQYENILCNILLKYKNNPSSFHASPKLYTRVCPTLIQYGIPLNTQQGNRISTLKCALMLAIHAPENSARKIFEILLHYMLEHGAIPNYDCFPKIYQDSQLDKALIKKLTIARLFYKKERDLADTIQLSATYKHLAFLITMAFCHNDTEALWSTNDHLKTKRSKYNHIIKVTDFYQNKHIFNPNYRKNYFPFKMMLTLSAMHQKGIDCDIHFTSK
jgi:hypothetical protein